MTSNLIRRDRVLVAITVMLDVAFHAGRAVTVSAADIADRVGLARRGIEPVFQTLSRAGLLESLRGPRGGYRLGRPARDIGLAEIAAAVGGGEEPPSDMPRGQLQDIVVEPLWHELDEALRSRLAGLTLNDLIRRAEAKGLRRTVAEPITFTI